MTQTEVLTYERGTTHRFKATFRDKVDSSVMTMDDATVYSLFIKPDGTETTPTLASKEATGIYYTDEYFEDTETLGTWIVYFYGTVQGSGEKKGEKKRFKLVNVK